jgi:hypothetical protein
VKLIDGEGDNNPVHGDIQMGDSINGIDFDEHFEVIDEKTIRKAYEEDLLKTIQRVAIQSLPPKMLVDLEVILNELAKNRHLKWASPVRSGDSFPKQWGMN